MAGGPSTFVVALGFGSAPMGASVSWTDITADVLDVTITRGKDSDFALGQYNPGSCAITILNLGYKYDPDNASSPYVGKLLPFTPVGVWAYNSSNALCWLFAGFVKPAGQWQQRHVGNMATTTIEAFDMLGYLATVPTANVVTVPLTQDTSGPTAQTGWASPKIDTTPGRRWFGEVRTSVPRAGNSNTEALAGPGLTGAFLNDVLANGKVTIPTWPPSSGKVFDTGISTLQAVALGDKALTIMQNAVEAERGFLYVDKAGTLRFDDRYGPITETRQNTSQATYDDALGATLRYSAEEFRKTYGANMVNRATITRSGGLPQTYTDAASVTAHGEQGYDKSAGYLTGDTDAYSFADWLVKAYSTPLSSPAEITVFPLTSTAAFDDMLARELRDRVTVNRKAPGAAAQVTTPVFIERITHKIQRGRLDWKTTYAFSPAGIYGFAGDATVWLKLDDTTYGKVLNSRGAWSSGATYVVGDFVDLGAQYWQCILGHTNHTPPNGTYWIPSRSRIGF